MLPLSKDTRLAARICRLFNVAVRTLSTTKEGIQYDFSSVDVSKHTIKLSDKQKKWRRKDLDGKSLIASTLSEMETDVSFQETLQKVKEVGKKKMTLEEKKIRRRCLDDLGVVGFREFLDANTTHRNIDKRGATDVFQLNIGLYCNQGEYMNYLFEGKEGGREGDLSFTNKRINNPLADYRTNSVQSLPRRELTEAEGADDNRDSRQVPRNSATFTNCNHT